MIPGFAPVRNRAAEIMIAVCGLSQFALHQTLPLAGQQLPSYEVATIKPVKDGHGPTLAVYILSAFGMPILSTQRLIGPEWVDKSIYDIQGKVPDSLREAMNNMTREERAERTELLMQSLLADRFKLKYHFETRQMQVYKLALAKGGIRMKVNSDPTTSGVRMNRTDQVCFIKGPARISDLVGLLGNFPEVGTKPVIDETGLPGRFYDVSLRWTSSVSADPASNSAPSDTDAPSLFTALQEELGLRLSAANAPVKVLVIDHIEPPSEN